jgi:hypothetical protein
VNKQYLGAGCSDDIIGQLSDLAQANPRFADPMTYIARCHFKAKNFKAACDAAREYAKRGAPETSAQQLIASSCK